MSQWNDGYVAGLDYMYAYQPELNPQRAALGLLAAGVAAPSILSACEIGFGQGVSTNLHAAASTTQWFGTDFSATHTGFARELAEQSGAPVNFFDESFAEFCGRPDLPEFDFIALHGVWTWISEENRRILVDFFRRRLKVGGALYISYNVRPGFAAMAPVRDLLSGYVESMGSRGQTLAHQTQRALEFAEKLLELSPLYSRAHSQIATQLKQLRSNDVSYVAHEYLNRNWVPTSFAHVTEQLAGAKLDYVCSANYFHLIDAWNLRPEQLALLQEIPDTSFRETARDFVTNCSFRAEYWVKGARRLSALERLESLSRQRVMLIRPPKDIPLKAVGALGEFALLESSCVPILNALADFRARSLGEIEQAVAGSGLALPQIADVVLTLIQIGGLAAVQDEAVCRAARVHTDKLNAFLCDRARRHTNLNYLASPVTGCGFQEAGGRVALLFLNAVKQGSTLAPELAQHVWRIFRAQGVAIFNQGKPIQSEEDSVAALTLQANHFLERQLPVLQAMQIA
jgi:SAM-dependent methyltransferase